MMKSVIKKKLMTGFFALLLLFTMVPVTQVNAENTGTYTVTFRPGNKGAFALNVTSQTDKKAKAEEVAAVLYAGYKTNVTDNGAIKIELLAGEYVPEAPQYVVAEAGYFVKNTSEWGPQNQTIIEKNLDYVVDYGKVVDGVEYTVRYVDIDSQESVAPSMIAYANIGEKREITVPEFLVLSGTAYYQRVSQANATMTLEQDSSKNVITFEYRLAPRGTEVTEVTTFTDGGTVTTTETNTTYVEGEAAAPGAVVAGDEGGVADAGEPVVDIEDEDTPLADQPIAADRTEENPQEEGENSETIIIDDEEVPLSNSVKFASGNSVLIWSGVAAAALFAVAVLWFMIRRKRAETQTSKEE